MDDGLHRHTSHHAPSQSASYGVSTKYRAVTESDLDNLNARVEQIELEIEALRRAVGPIIKDAIAEALIEIIATDGTYDSMLDKFWKAAGRRSVKAAGLFTLGIFSDLPKTIFKYAIVGMIIYQLGGWSLVSSAFKTWFSGPKP